MIPEPKVGMAFKRKRDCRLHVVWRIFKSKYSPTTILMIKNSRRNNKRGQRRVANIWSIAQYRTAINSGTLRRII